jgi:hypothetical protein
MLDITTAPLFRFATNSQCVSTMLPAVWEGAKGPLAEEIGGRGRFVAGGHRNPRIGGGGV